VEVSRDNNHNATSEAEKQASASRNVSLFFSVRSLGVLLTAYTGGVLLEHLNKKQIFMITSIFPFVLALTSFSLPEKFKSSQEQREQLQED
jgi:predicted MFS family arabinose efflux permease